MKRTLLSLGLAAGVALAGPAAAARYDRGVEYDYARVVSVDPIVDQYDEPIARNVCYDQPVEYYRAGGRRSSATPAIVGAIIGGAVGNQFGSGHGRDAATVAGALLGGSIGRDNARRNGYYEPERRYTGYEERCEVRTDYRRNERVVGYDVEYEYNGRIYHTRTDSHPGRRIQVAVDVLPLR